MLILFDDKGVIRVDANRFCLLFLALHKNFALQNYTKILR